MNKSISLAIKVFKKNHGILKTSDAIKLGIHPEVFYRLKDENIIDELSRGVYKLTKLDISENIDLITISLKYPDSVVCLISALSYYNLTNEIAHYNYIAFKKGHRVPINSYPPIKTFLFSESMFNIGIEEIKLNGIKVKIYNPEKTLIDCFRYRNKIGLDIFLESLKIYFQKYKPNYLKLIEYAKICKVEKTIKPYLEMMI